MSSSGSYKIYLSDDSDDIELQSESKRVSGRRTRSTSNNTSKDYNGKKESDEVPSPLRKDDDDDDDDNEEPDWVRDFSAKQNEDEDRKRALASMYEDDNDSVIDLLSDKDEEDKVEVGADDDVTGDGKAEITDNKSDKVKRPPSAKISAPASMKSSLPLVVAPKLADSLVLLQGNGDELDLSGDVGTVGRVKIADGTMYIDMKGGVFRAQAYACNTMGIVSLADDEARVTAVLDEAVTLHCERNLFSSDQLIKGELDGDVDPSTQPEAPVNVTDAVATIGSSTVDKKDIKSAGRKKSGERAGADKPKSVRGRGVSNARITISKTTRKKK